MNINNKMFQGSSAFNHFALFKSKSRTREVADDAMVSIAGSQDLQTQFGLTRDQAGFGLNAFSITGTLISDKCPQGRQSLKDHNVMTRVSASRWSL